MKRYCLLFAAILLLFTCKNTPHDITMSPVIEAPVLSISTITILQERLVNTRFKVTIHIENPNPFPVSLSSFTYELYGEGYFWTDGTEKNVFTVPADDFVEKDLFFVMNFIDMKRDLLDKVIAMESVAYRFTGSVEINAEDMPALITQFNLEGESEVTH